MSGRAYRSDDRQGVQARLGITEAVMTDQLERQIEDIISVGALPPCLRVVHPIRFGRPRLRVPRWRGRAGSHRARPPVDADGWERGW